MDIKSKSLSDALNAALLPELPKQYRDDDNNFWIKAIVLVKKRDTSVSYAIAKRNSDGRIVYAGDFGTPASIIGLLSIHPYEFLDAGSYLPYRTIEEERQALGELLGNDYEIRESIKSMSDDEVHQALLELAIERQNTDMAMRKANDTIFNCVVEADKSSEIEAYDTNDIPVVTDSQMAEMARSKSKLRGRPRKSRS